MSRFSIPTLWIKRPFTLLVLTLTGFLFFLFPFRDSTGGAIVPRVFITLIFFSSLYAIMRRRHAAIAAIALMIPPLVLTWGDSVLFGSDYSIVRLGATAGFLVFVSGMVLSDVMRTERVTMDTISGGLAVYLLLGLVFTEIYTMLLVLDPAAISFPLPREAGDTASIAYYSFVTLTTLGYGDIVPVSKAARAMASLEAVMGQVYMTVLVARLVGLHISQVREKPWD
jgi:voltage-gated potassium channel